MLRKKQVSACSSKNFTIPLNEYNFFLHFRKCYHNCFIVGRDGRSGYDGAQV
jgi:hypothetical protein